MLWETRALSRQSKITSWCTWPVKCLLLLLWRLSRQFRWFKVPNCCCFMSKEKRTFTCTETASIFWLPFWRCQFDKERRENNISMTTFVAHISSNLMQRWFQKLGNFMFPHPDYFRQNNQKAASKLPSKINYMDTIFDGGLNWLHLLCKAHVSVILSN